jgi:teichuronic acid biosynthesis glycosyltransferase TuaC
LNVLTFTSLYPNSVSPDRGVFVEHLMNNMVRRHQTNIEVVSPLPWFPFKSDIFGTYSSFARVPTRDIRAGIPVEYPRRLVIPKIGMNFAPRLMRLAVEKIIRQRVGTSRDFDLIDSHYLYPDGVVAAKIARSLSKPVILTAHGSDVNVIAHIPYPKKMILQAIQSASAVVTVSEALRHSLCELGADPEKVIAIHNGVDLKIFAPMNRQEALDRLGLKGPLIVTVGNILEAKGQHLVVRALAQFPELQYLIVGTGPNEREVQRIAGEAGVASRVHFMGRWPHEDLAHIYGAADAMILASAREGCPGVVLESQACGTPVIATNVGGVSEIVGPGTGVIIKNRTVKAIADGISQILNNPPDRIQVRVWAERFSWDETADKQINLFTKILAKSR